MRKKNKTLLLWAAGAAGAVLVVRHLTTKKSALQAAGWGIVDIAPPYGRGYSQPWGGGSLDGFGTPWNPSLEPWMQGSLYSPVW